MHSAATSWFKISLLICAPKEIIDKRKLQQVWPDGCTWFVTTIDAHLNTNNPMIAEELSLEKSKYMIAANGGIALPAAGFIYWWLPGI